MISKEIIEREILEREEKDTTYANCERLAWLYIIRDHLNGQEVTQPQALLVRGESDFLKAVSGKDSVKVWAVIDELAQTIKAIHPRLYDGVMRRLADI
jgi:hypothetical protein